MEQVEQEREKRQGRRKKTKAEVFSLIVKAYSGYFFFLMVPLAILLLQICQVWADSASVRLYAQLAKWLLIAVLSAYCFHRIRDKRLRKEAIAPTEIRQEKKSPFVQEDTLPDFNEIREENTEAVQEAGIQVINSPEESLIPVDMYIHGDIETKKSLAIYGAVDGNISSGGDVRIYGLVKGNIRCRNLYVDKAEIEGDIQCEERVYLSHKCILIGNIVAWEMVCKGYVQGNAFIRKGVCFTKSSEMIGDVASMEIQVEEGASIKGKMRIESIT